jgi:type VI secretion system protein ImpM
MTQPLPTVLGYYGKLPARGDFVGRRLPRETIGLWDGWLQEAVAASREALGAGWLDLYLVSPLWRFVLPAGLCGSTNLAGILMPSVDKVGRAFPLMLAVEFDAGLPLATLLAGGSDWFAAIEDLALSALAEDFALDRLDAPVAAHRLGPATGSLATRPIELGPIGHCLPLGGPDDARVLTENGGGTDRSFWWTNGSQRVAPVLVLARGLPAPDGFAAFIDGDWTERRWSVGSIADKSAITPEAFDALPAAEAEVLPWDRKE